MRKKKYIRIENVYFAEWMRKLPPTHFNVLMVIISRLSKLNLKELQISYFTLSVYSGISHPTLIKAVQNLENHQLIHVKRNGGRHGGCIANTYSLKKVLANKN